MKKGVFQPGNYGVDNEIVKLSTKHNSINHGFFPPEESKWMLATVVPFDYYALVVLMVICFPVGCIFSIVSMLYYLFSRSVVAYWIEDRELRVNGENLRYILRKRLKSVDKEVRVENRKIAKNILLTTLIVSVIFLIIYIVFPKFGSILLRIHIFEFFNL